MSAPINRRELLTLGAAWVAREGCPEMEQNPVKRETTTAVRGHRGRPVFTLNGQPYTKPVFETYVPEERYFRQFAVAGTEVFSFSTNLGAGFWFPTWLGPDSWDFSHLDELAHRVIKANPNGLLLPRILLSTPDWWVAQNPEECQILANGKRTYTPAVSMGRGGKAYPSIVSAKWRRDMGNGLKRVLHHIRESDYGAHLFGVMVTGLMTEEWYHWSIHTNELADYSPHATRAFQKWLRQRYRTTDALRKAWNAPEIDYHTVTVPPQEARQRGRERTFRAPATEKNVIDYYLFYNEIIPDTIDYFCGVAKEVTERKKVVGAFYAFMFEFGGDPEFGHNALGRLVQSKNLDFVMVTASYGNRELGTGADYMRAPITSVALHQKLWYHDNDTVSFRFREIHSKGSWTEETIRNEALRLGATETPPETIWQYRRGAGFVLGNGVFQSFFDLHGGYFDDPQLLEEIKRLNVVFEESKQYNLSSCAEVLLVADETSCAYTTFQSPLLEQTLRPTQVSLCKMGAPYDCILTDDLALLDTARYKLVIFLNAYHLTDAQRRLIRRKLLNRGRTVLWCYAPGYFNGSVASVEAMRALTGINIVPSENEARFAPGSLLRHSDHPLIRRFQESGVELMGDRLTSGTRIGPHGKNAKLFSVQDGDAITLGTLDSPGQEAVTLASKKMRGWTSYYTITPVLPPLFYRELARLAGVHIYNDRDEALYANRSYLTVAANQAGPRTLHLPQKSDVFDPFTGAKLHAGVIEFTHEFAATETGIFRLARL